MKENKFNEDGLRPIEGTNREGGCNFYTTLESTDANIREAGQGLYIWTTIGAYKLARKHGERPEVKFGQYGSNGAAKLPQDTIASYWLKAPQGPSSVPVLLWAQKITDAQMQAWVDVNAPGKEAKAIYLENYLQEKYTNLGLKSRDGNGTEWFHNEVNNIIKDVNVELFGVRKLLAFEPRLPQQACIDLMTRAYYMGKDDFLMGCIMRFGKNFTLLKFVAEIARREETNLNVIVPTNKPGVFDSLIDDINSHVDFTNFEVILLKDEKDKANLKLDPNKTSVVLCSKQLYDNEKAGPAVGEFIQSIFWDVAFIDECHSGTLTDKFDELINSLDVKFKVWASGTPFRTNATRDFDDDNRFFYGYIEQQNDKKAGIIDGAVTLETYVPRIHPSIRDNPDFQDDAGEGFNFNKFFGNYKSHEGDIRNFFARVFGLVPCNTEFQAGASGANLDHVVINIPSGVPMAAALTKILQNLFGDDRYVINATGNKNTKVATKVREVHDAIRRHKKTLTLTYRRFVEGTTVPEWHTVMMMNDSEALEHYFQFIFRAASPAPGKDTARVIDFSPNRQLQMTYEMSLATAINNGDKQEVINSWIACNPIYHAMHSESAGFEQVGVDEVLACMLDQDNRATRLLHTPNAYINFDRVTDSVLQAFANAPANTTITNKVKKLIDNEMEKAKTYNGSAAERVKQEIEPDALELIIKQIAGMVSKLPAVAFMLDLNSLEKIVDPSANGLGDRSADDIFKSITKVDRNDIYRAVMSGVLDTRMINIFL